MTQPAPRPAPLTEFCFVLVDHTTDATPAAMRPAGRFADMMGAWQAQIDGEFAQAWGDQTVSFRVASGPTDRATNEIALNFRDTIPEAPGALAYHEVVNGVPDIELGVDLFTSLVDGQESLSCGGSHELLELLRDAGANGWKERQDGSGVMDAEEACDFVQNTSYQAPNGVTVSNFVTPPFFVPGSAGPWDYLGVMQTQYDVSHGYGITAPSPSATTQIGGARATHVGKLTELQRRRKAHPYSRTSRRGVKLPPVAAAPPAP